MIPVGKNIVKAAKKPQRNVVPGEFVPGEWYVCTRAITSSFDEGKAYPCVKRSLDAATFIVTRGYGLVDVSKLSTTSAVSSFRRMDDDETIVD